MTCYLENQLLMDEIRRQTNKNTRLVLMLNYIYAKIIKIRYCHKGILHIHLEREMLKGY